MAQESEAAIIVPNDLDVLCGSRSTAATHPGNARFRSILEKHFPKYELALTKTEKTKVTREIMKEVVSLGSRFLKRDPIFEKKWYFVDTMKVGQDKISHSLRDMLKAARRSSNRDPQAPTQRRAAINEQQQRQHRQQLRQEISAVVPPIQRNDAPVKARAAVRRLKTLDTKIVPVSTEPSDQSLPSSLHLLSSPSISSAASIYPSPSPLSPAGIAAGATIPSAMMASRKSATESLKMMLLSSNYQNQSPLYPAKPRPFSLDLLMGHQYQAPAICSRGNGGENQHEEALTSALPSAHQMEQGNCTLQQQQDAWHRKDVAVPSLARVEDAFLQQEPSYAEIKDLEGDYSGTLLIGADQNCARHSSLQASPLIDASYWDHIESVTRSDRSQKAELPLLESKPCRQEDQEHVD